MAAFSQTGTLTFQREQSEVYEIDRYYRYEITATNSGYVIGALWIRKDIVAAADAEPDTIAITTA